MGHLQRFFLLSLSFLLLTSAQSALAKTPSSYPAHWWQAVERDSSVPDWEILPQEAGKNEVILSKRNELGLLSNFADTPFTFRGKSYASMEGFWQAMKFPEDLVDGQKDPRLLDPKLYWSFTRQEVEQMTGFAAKKAGDEGSSNMKKMGMNWVSFEHHSMPYRVQEKGAHYQIIKQAMEEKLKQNPEVLKVLLMTGDLILRPDHKVGSDNPPAWQYYTIWMELRQKYQQHR